MLSQLRVQFILPQVLFVIGTLEHPGRGASPDSGSSGKVTHFPLLPSSALSPGSGLHRSTNLTRALATRGTEEQKTRRRLPFCKRQAATPQKEIEFPSVSPWKNGRGWGSAAAPIPGSRKRPWIFTQSNPGAEGLVQTAALGRQTQQHPLCLLGLCFQKRNSKARGGEGENQTKPNQTPSAAAAAAMFCVLYTVRVFLPTVFW